MNATGFQRVLRVRPASRKPGSQSVRHRFTTWIAWGLMLTAVLCLVATPGSRADESTPGSSFAPESTTAIAPVIAPSLATAPAGFLTLPGATSGLTVGVIPISGTIDRFTYTLLKRKAEQAIQDGCGVIVLEVDTFGGRADWALEISRYVKSLTARGVYTIAWINSKAYSAGILISAACQQIVVAPGSQTGDCAPIIPGAELKPTERAKALTPLLAEFRDSGGQERYAAYQAMCVLGVEVYLVEHPQTGKRMLVNQVDRAMMVEGLSREEAESEHGWNSGGAVSSADVGGPANFVAMDEDLGAWRVVEKLPSGETLPDGRVHDGRTLLTVSGKQANDTGLATGSIASDSQLSQYTQAANINRYKKTWAEPVAEFLLHPAIRTVLVLAMLVGFYIELNAPGTVLPGALGLIALLGLLVAPFVLGLAAVWHVLLFLAGFILLVVELLLTPTFGVLGVVGLLGMLAGLIFSVIPATSGGSAVSSNLVWTYGLSLATALLLSFIVIAVLTKYFGTIPVFSRLVLDESALHTSNPEDAKHIEGEEVLGAGFIQVGMTGQAATDLLPGGQARFEDHQIDVVSDGGFIEKGAAVSVIDTSSNRVMVAKA